MNKKYDLIVVGGGFSGIAAAIEAAREKLSVLIVEKYNCLGGAAMNCLILPFMPRTTTVDDKKISLAGGIFEEVIAELKKLGGSDETGFYFDEEILKLVLNRMCIENGVELLFNTTITEVKTENGVIKSVVGWGKSDKVELFADNFVDATGDAELSCWAEKGTTAVSP